MRVHGRGQGEGPPLVAYRPGHRLGWLKRPCGNGSPSTEGLAPMLAPTLGDSGQFQTTPDKTAGGGDGAESPTGDGVSGGGVKRRLPPSTADEGSELVGVIGFEPTTSCSQSRHSSQAELHPDEFPTLFLRNLVVPRAHRQEQSLDQGIRPGLPGSARAGSQFSQLNSSSRVGSRPGLG